MSATDELRRLLDERGIEHMDFNMPERSLTLFAGGEHDGAYTENSVDTILTVCGASPAQAVGATLGRGECRRVLYEPTGVLVCSECGAGIPKQLDKYCYLHYCPNCGRKVRA